jgi:hypothetical protein
LGLTFPLALLGRADEVIEKQRDVRVGTFETCRLHRAMSGFGGKAENICSF